MTTGVATTRLPSRPVGLLAAAHIGPALAVTLLAGLLALAQGLGPARGAARGRGSAGRPARVGWSNDLVDLSRDHRTGRGDKPLVAGAVSVGAVRAACVVAVLACVVLSLACGLVAGLVHLAVRGCRVGLQPGPQGDRVVLGALRRRLRRAAGFVALAGDRLAAVVVAGRRRPARRRCPPPQRPARPRRRRGDRRARPAAPARSTVDRAGRVAVLVSATAVVLLGSSTPPAVALPAAAVVAGLAAVVVVAPGRRPLPRRVGIALVDAAMLVAAR